MIIVYIIGILLILIFIIFKNKVFLYIPLIILFIQFAFPYITDIYHTNFAYSRSSVILSSLQIAFVFGISFYTLFIYRKTKKLFGVDLVFICFLLFMFFNSTNYEASFKALLRFMADLILLPVGYIYFRRNPSKKFFYQIVLLTCISALFYIAYCSFYKIGYDYYGNSVLFFGGLRLFGLYLFVYAMPTLIINTFQSNTYKYLKIALIVGILIVLTIAFKRALILLSFFSIVLFFIFFIRKSRKVIFISISILSLTFISIYFYRNQIYQSIERRAKSLEVEIQDQGRYIEYLIILDEYIKTPSLKTLIGNDLFNNHGKFGIDNEFGLKTENRGFHSDYAHLLYGSGILGFFLFLTVYYKVYLRYKICVRYVDMKTVSFRMNQYGFLAIFFLLLINQFIDGIFIFFARGFAYFSLSYYLANLTNEVNKLNHLASSSK